jgi:hypothetical protein
MENYDSPTPHFSPVLIIVYLLIIFISIAGLWKVFTKAGKPGWAAIIPIYNLIVLLEIVGKPLWWFLLIIFPCTSFIFLIWTYNLLSKSFGKSEGFTVGLVLLNPIFICILGFGDAVYLGPSAKEAQAANRFGAGDYQQPPSDTNV